MNKFISVACAVACGIGVIGCKTMPTTDKMYAIANSIGIAAGMVANQTSIDNDTRNAVVDIVGIVRECVPETNQTFTAAWTPIAQAHTDKLIAEGKIDAAQGVLVMSAFNAVVTGIDYVFYRYPAAKQYQDLTSAAIDGFADGFLAVFKPVNSRCSDGAVLYDATAYKFIKAKCAK